MRQIFAERHRTRTAPKTPPFKWTDPAGNRGLSLIVPARREPVDVGYVNVIECLEMLES